MFLIDIIFQIGYWPSGKMIGGSSNLNFMQYVRGNRHDYDIWASSGSAGWSYEDVLPYFLKSEDNRNSNLSKTSRFNFGLLC